MDIEKVGQVVRETVESVGAEVRKTSDGIGERMDRNHENRVRRWAEFSPRNLEKAVKRVVLVVGVALVMYAIGQGIANLLLVNRICKTVEVLATLAMGQP